MADLGRAVFGVLGVLAISGAMYAHDSVVYAPVEATVVWSKTTCYLVAREEDGKPRRDGYSNRIRGLSCEGWDHNYHIRRKYRRRYLVQYEFKYISPVDGSAQSGSYERDRRSNEVKYADGDKVTILAHKTMPDRYSF